MDVLMETAVAECIEARPEFFESDVIDILRKGISAYLLANAKDRRRRQEIFEALVLALKDLVRDFYIPYPFNRYHLTPHFFETLYHVLPRWSAIREKGIQPGVRILSTNGRTTAVVARVYPSGRLLAMKDGGKGKGPLICDPEWVEVIKSPE